jgi:hypothetical protein
MQFIDIPTEQTTALTDAILTLLAFAATLYVLRFWPDPRRLKAGVWAGTFGLLTLASALGTVAHGFKMAPETYLAIWQPLNFSLGLTVAMFVAAVFYDLWGPPVTRRALPFLFGLAVVFYIISRLFPDTFLPFVIYGAGSMLFALAGYIWLAARGRSPGAALLVLGVLLTLVAFAVQATGLVRFQFIWQFDHNSAFHLIEMVAVVLLVLGVRNAFLSKPAGAA